MRTDIENGTFTTPATPTQEALWWVHQRAQNKSVYNVTWRLACNRPVDFGALGIAWQAMVDRHEALRTSVTRLEDTVELTVRPHVTAELRRVDVDDLGAAEPGTLLRLIAEEVQEQTMPLDRASLARLTLVRVGDEYELLLTVHHVALDGWAIQLLLNELSTAYSAASDRRQPTFDGDPVPFHCYAEELHTANAQGRWRPSLDYWRATLDGAASTTVAADLRGEFASGAAGAVFRYAFSDEAVLGIQVLTKATYATPFAVVLGALEIVLARGGAGSDVAIGVVVANRMNARDQNLIGYIANLCIARITVNDDDSIVDVVERSRDGMWAMLAHQSVPYPAVFAALSESTQAALGGTAPLLLSYLGPIGNSLRLSDVEMTLQQSPNRAARADIAISTWDANDGLLAEVEFNTGRYRQDTVTRLMHDLDAMLAAGGVDPRRGVGSLIVHSRSVAGQADHRPGSTLQDPVDLPESTLWRQVSQVWAELLGSPPKSPDVDFFSVGGNSLKAVQFTTEIESQTGIGIDIVGWLSEPTPRWIVAQLSEDTPDFAGSAMSTLIRLREGTEPHLHMVHGAGSSLHDYRDLLAALPGHWLVTLSQEREPLATVPMMARCYRADLDVAELRPDIIGGWSMGGQIAYEMVSGYEASRPALVVLDSAPPIGYDIPADAEEERFATFAAIICRSLGVELNCSLPLTMGDREVSTCALAACLGESGQQVPASLLLERWQIYARHLHAVAGYVRTGCIDTPALIVGAELLDVQLDQWVERVGRAPQILRVHADHFGMLRAGTAKKIAADMEEFACSVAAQR